MGINWSPATRLRPINHETPLTSFDPSNFQHLPPIVRRILFPFRRLRASYTLDISERLLTFSQSPAGNHTITKPRDNVPRCLYP